MDRNMMTDDVFDFDDYTVHLSSNDRLVPIQLEDEEELVYLTPDQWDDDDRGNLKCRAAYQWLKEYADAEEGTRPLPPVSLPFSDYHVMLEYSESQQGDENKEDCITGYYYGEPDLLRAETTIIGWTDIPSDWSTESVRQMHWWNCSMADEDTRFPITPVAICYPLTESYSTHFRASQICLLQGDLYDVNVTAPVVFTNWKPWTREAYRRLSLRDRRVYLDVCIVAGLLVVYSEDREIEPMVVMEELEASRDRGQPSDIQMIICTDPIRTTAWERVGENATATGPADDEIAELEEDALHFGYRLVTDRSLMPIDYCEGDYDGTASRVFSDGECPAGYTEEVEMELDEATWHIYRQNRAKSARSASPV